MAYTSPATRSNGYVVGATQWNEFVNNHIWANETTSSGRPFCRVHKGSHQLMAHATNTAVSWDANDLDPTGCHSTSVNPSRFTAPVAGWYRLDTNVRWEVNSSATRHAYIVENGSGYLSAADERGAIAIFDTGLGTLTHYAHLSAGGYVEVFGMQTSGGNLNCLGNGLSWAWFEWVGTY